MRESSINVCIMCGAEAEFYSLEGVWRHKSFKVERCMDDLSILCEKYDYPISVRDKSLVEVVCEVLDGLVLPE